MIKGAIFDVDGTLLDSMGIWEDAGKRYLHSIRVEPEENLSTVLFSMTLEEGAIYVRERYSLSQTVPEIVQGVLDEVRDFYYEEAPLKEGAKELLQALAERKIPMAVATSSEREYVEAAFRRLHIRQYFKEIFTCSEVGAGKSQPLIYETAANCLGTKPEETYVFEDVLHAIRTANGAGFQTVGIYDKYSEKDQEEIKRHASFYLPDFKNIERKVKNENGINNRWK